MLLIWLLERNLLPPFQFHQLLSTTARLTSQHANHIVNRSVTFTDREVAVTRCQFVSYITEQDGGGARFNVTVSRVIVNQSIFQGCRSSGGFFSTSAHYVFSRDCIVRCSAKLRGHAGVITLQHCSFSP
jgi:hypothetical protein